MSSVTGVQKLIEKVVPARRFGELRTPLTVVCTDLQAGAPVVFDTGDLIPPVLGSCLAAGAFNPIFYQGCYLVDGGYTDPVPVSQTRSDELVVVVDPTTPPTWPLNLERASRGLVRPGRVWAQALKGFDTLIYSLVEERMAHHSAIRIKPDLPPTMRFNAFDQADTAIEAGRTAMQSALARVFAMRDTGE
jgi:predicted acylesterase/phospholipase RssA